MKKHVTRDRWLTGLTLASYFWSYVLMADQIVVDGKTQTAIAVSGRVSDVTTSTISGGNAYNSFSVFDVNRGNVVNLHLPDGTSSLLNLVHDKTSNIDGVLNSIRNGAIGGNVYFANPYGIVVGSSGVINVGSLALSTPSPGFMSEFFAGPGAPSPTATAALQRFELPISENGLITIRGQINARGDIRTDSAGLSNSGSIQSGARFVASAPDFSDVINTADVVSGSSLAIENGEIFLVASGDVEHSGVIAARGGDGLDAGKVTITAGNDIRFTAGSVTDASGQGADSAGGVVHVYAGNNASLQGSTIDVSGGTVSGDAGFAEFSAARRLELGGGTFLAGAVDGKQGSFLIDPAALTISGVNAVGGGGMTFTADQTLTVAGDALVSSRVLASGDHATGISSADSGDLTFKAAEIVIEGGAQVYAQANGGHASGDVSFEAASSIAAANDVDGGTAVSGVTIGAATIKGGNITAQAHSTTANETTDSALANKVLKVLGLIDLEAFEAGGLQSGAVKATATAEVRVASGATLVADNDVNLTSSADADARISTLELAGVVLPVGVAASYANSTADARTVVEGGANVTAGDTVNVAATATNVVKVTTRGLSADSIVLSISEVTTGSRASIADGATIVSDNLSIDATSRSDLETKAGPITLIGGAAAGIALSQLNSTADAVLGADLAISGDLDIAARSESTANLTDANAKVKPSIVAGVPDKIRKLFGTAKQPTSTKTEPAGASAAMAIAESSHIANASIGKNSQVAADNVKVDAQTSDKFKLLANAETETDQFALGSASTLGTFSNAANAFIDDAAVVDAAGQVEVFAKTSIPSPVDFGALAFWEQDDFVSAAKGLFDLVAKTGETLAEALVTTYTGASSSAKEGLGIAGMYSEINVDNDADAHIGNGARVNTDSATASDSQSVSVTARNEIEAINVTGNLEIKAYKPTGVVGESRNALGGAVNNINYEVGVEAYVADGAEVNAKSDVTVDAGSTAKIVNVSVAGGKAAKYGLEGSVNLIDVDSTVRAFVDDKATVRAGNDVNINAWDQINDLSISGGIIKGANVGIGFSWAVNTVESTVVAFFGNDEEADSPDLLSDPGAIVAGNDLAIDADSTHNVNAFSLAASAGGPGTSTDAKSTAKGSAGFGASGDVSLNTISGKTSAYVGDGVSVDPDAVLRIAASNLANVRAVSGSGSLQSGASSSGVAGSYSENTISTVVTAFVEDVLVVAPSDGTYTVIDIDAKSEGGIFSLAVGGSSSGKVGVAGSVAVNEIGGSSDAIETEAYIKDSTVERANIDLDARDSRGITSITGALAVSGTAGIGPSLSINNSANNTRAYLENSTVQQADGIAVNATNDNGIFSLSASAGVGTTTFGGAGSLSYNTIGNSAEAYVDGGSVVGALHDIEFNATDTSEIDSIAGGGAFGATVGVGVSAAYNDIDNRIVARVDGADLNTAGSVRVSADSAADIETFGVGIGASTGTAGLAGSVSINKLRNEVVAEVVNGSIVSADENVRVAATNRNSLLVVAGSASGGAAGGGNGALVINVVDNDTMAAIVDSDVNADANGAGLAVHTGEEGAADGNLDATELVTGVIVEAYSREDVTSANVNGSGGGTAGVAASTSVSTIKDTTKAYVSSSRINDRLDGAYVDDASAEQQVRVAAYERVEFGGGSGNVAGGGAAGVGVGVDVVVVQNTTQAYIEQNSDVRANELIGVAAGHRENILSVSVGGAGGGTVGVVGSGNGARLASTTEAFTRDSDLASDSDIQVHAREAANLVQIAGGVAGGGAVGVTGAVGVGIVENTTRAYLGTGTTSNAKGGTSVTADSDETIDHYVISASGGGELGVAANVSVKVAGSTTLAFVDNGVELNQDTDDGSDEQDVLVRADSDLTILGATGGASGGGAVGGGAAIDLDFVKNTTTAYIGDSAKVDAKGDIAVEADASKDVKSFAVGGGGGGAVGISAMVSVVNVGAKLDAESRGEVGNSGSHADGQVSGDVTAGADSSDSFASAAASEAGTDNSGTTVSGHVNEKSSNALNRTSAFIGDFAAVESGGALRVSSLDATTVAQHVGGISVGAGGAIGGAVGIVNTNTSNQSVVGKGAELRAGGNIDVSAGTDNTLASNAYAGTAGLVALGASVAIVNDSSVTLAEIEDDVVVDRAGNVNISADSAVDVDTLAFGATVGGGAVGASVARSTSSSTTKARVDDAVMIGQGAGSTVGGLGVVAKSDADVDSRAIAGAAGIVAGSGSDARSDIRSATDATIGQGTFVDVTNAIAVDAGAYTQGKAEADGLNVAGGAVGISIARAESDPDIDASVGANSALTAGAGIAVKAAHNRDRSDLAMAARAVAITGGIAGVSGADSRASVTPEVDTLIGDGAKLIAVDDAIVDAISVANADADASGVAVGGVAAGFTDSEALVDGKSRTTTGSAVSIEADNIKVGASSNLVANADTIGGNGGLLSGGGTSGKGRIDNTVSTIVGADSILAAAGDVDVAAGSALDAYSNARINAGGGVTINEVSADTDIVNDTTVDIAADATLKGDRVSVLATVNKLRSYASAFSQTLAVGSDSNARSYVDVDSDVKATVHPGAELIGQASVAVGARTSGLDFDSIANAKITAGLTGNLSAIADGSLNADSDVDLQAGSITTAPEISLVAETVSNSGDFNRSASADADTVVNWVLKSVESSVKVVSWIPFIGSFIEWVTRTTLTWVADVAQSDVKALTTGGDPRTDNSIIMDGTLAQLTALSPELTVNSDGSISSDGNINASLQNGEVVVNGVNNNVTGTMDIRSPGGVVSGNGTLLLNKTFDSVNVTNNSAYDLRINNIEVVATNAEEPELNIDAAVDATNFQVVSEVDVSDVNITGHTDADIIIAGRIANPAGTAVVVNDHGDIYGDGGLIEANRITVTATNGDIGRLGNRMDLEVVKDAGNAVLNVHAGGSAYLDVQLSEYVAEVPAGYVLDGLDFGDLTVGGDMVVGLKAGTAYDLSEVPGVGPSAVAVRGVYRATNDVVSGGDMDFDIRPGASFAFTRMSSQDGSVDLDYQDGDAVITRIEALNGGVSVQAAGAILNGNPLLNGVTAANISARDLKLVAQGGGIGAGSKSLEISQGAGGTLDADAAGDVHLSSKDGGFGIGLVSSAGNAVSMLVNGSIIDANDNDDENIVADRVAVVATGSVGQAGSRIVVDSGASAGSRVEVSADGGVHLEERDGNLVSDSIAASAGSVELLVTNGNASLGKVTAGDDVAIVVKGTSLSVGAIDPANVSLTVTGDDGVIEVATVAASDSISASADSVVLGQVVHSGGAGSSLDMHVVGDLTSNAIGSASGGVDLDVTGTASLGSLTAAQAVVVNATGNLAATGIRSTGGTVDVDVGGDATIGKITSPSDVSVAVGGQSLAITEIDPQRIVLSVAGEGGRLNLGTAYASDFVSIRADNIEVAKLVDSDGQSLALQISGNDGNNAVTANLRDIVTTGSVRFDTYRALNGYVKASTDSTYFKELIVGQSLRIDTKSLLVKVDYKDAKDNENSDNQETRGVPIKLLIEGAKVTTDGHENLYISKEKH